MEDFQTNPQPDNENQPRQEPSGHDPAKGRVAWIAVAIVGITVFLLTGIIFAGYKLASSRGGVWGGAPELPPPSARVSTASPSPVELSNSFREIAKLVKPAVVNINVFETVSQGGGLGDFFGFEGPGNAPRRRPGTGSGFIVTPDGFILTNEHVVGNAEGIEVVLSDNRRFKAEVVGKDPESDLAVIKIDASNLPIAVLGNSDAVEQGDWVLAIGSPFGLTQTLTAGIVSATGREFPDAPQYSKFIQTDASINPGNSGGPLVNMQGEVIGINTMIVSRTGGNVGIGFAIASNVGRKVFSEIAKTGRVTRGYLGVNVQMLDAPKARALGVEPESGALVARVNEDTPAQKAGIQFEDVITAFDGKPVKAPRELTDAVAATPVGKRVRVDLIRKGQPESVMVEIAERPANVNARQAVPEEGREGEPQQSRLGIAAQTLTPEMAERGKLNSTSGALVRSVTPGSPAQEAGIRHGDVILRVDRTDIARVEDLAEAEKSLKSGEDIAVKVERAGQMLLLNVTVP